MYKDFDKWNLFKQQVNAKEKSCLFKERDVWWCNLGCNIGDEQNGKGTKFLRPVLIYRKFSRNIFIGLPLSTKLKDKSYYLKISLNGIDQSIILSQIRLLDAKRLSHKLGAITDPDHALVKEKIKDLMC